MKQLKNLVQHLTQSNPQQMKYQDQQYQLKLGLEFGLILVPLFFTYSMPLSEWPFPSVLCRYQIIPQNALQMTSLLGYLPFSPRQNLSIPQYLLISLHCNTDSSKWHSCINVTISPARLLPEWVLGLGHICITCQKICQNCPFLKTL